ncbi:hypothetical protein Tco_1055760 [Tanacetum coccineum]|uniref:Uncharacterized protein n=1 Tax=Tanacetum coccineum TaxID=301880 RepID=A0ABQ5H0J8_9ASTR
MSITKEQQQALDDALVLPEQRLRIGNCNYRLSTTFKPKEPTFQVALDVLSLTQFYQAFLNTASVPAIYMHEFWATKFVNPPFEEEIIAFIRELGYSGNVKSLSDIKVDTLPQPWRTFGTIINKCLSGKVTGLDLHRLSRAQILWGMYHQKYVEYVYLLWEDLVYQVENKVSKKNKDINEGVIGVQDLYDLATGKVAPKPKYVWRSTREKTKHAPKASSGKRLKATAKVTKSGKKKQPAKGLETLSEIALTKAAQMKIVTKISKTQFHSSHVSGSGVDEGTGVSLGVPDVPTYGSEDELVSWKKQPQ